ncbi:GNAT family N-acetyltransferase [Bradyrhizobium genosp. L]|uniref:GNAT family N-acetyltransferase n=1 Tax=Bradyrhizobium genosp. L TaxID=83637 RepID=UPI0018A2E3F1|nr:GNAT family N-acetyltransferase [Bradyrhizobium genosp. L]QPF82473.1 GNAT family N-acetyltransferase [Bradyrhizobium genosp. L]
MTEVQIEIRRLTSADVALFRDIRLEALRSSPEAFASAFETEKLLPVGWFAERLERATVLGAFDGRELVGILGLSVDDGPKKRHKGLLVSMYVRSAARRARVGRRLIDAALELAAQSVELVQLGVTKGNDAALRLYQSAGFIEYGLERHALKIDGRYYDEILMAKQLTSDGNSRVDAT